MTRLRRFDFLPVAALAVLLLAVPVIAADPSPSAAPPGQQKEKPGPPDHAAEKARAPKVEVTLSGTVRETTDEQGRPTFTLTSGGTTYELSAGPKWFHGDDSPLKAFVGKSVEIRGSHREGSTDVSVATVDGTALRAAGRPPWAGGPKALGEGHPGWKPWFADGQRGLGLGRAHAPGQLKEKPGDSEDESGD